MAWFGKNRESEGEQPERESASDQVQGAEQERAQAVGANADESAQAEGVGADASAQAEAAGAAPRSSTPAKRRFGKKRARNKRMIRVEELEEALADDEDIDVDAIVSMYMPKRRMARIGEALLRVGTLQKVLICVALFMAVLFGVSFMQENMGNFTINLNRLELFRRGVAIADNSQFEGATARLAAEAVSYGTNIAAEDLPDNLDEIDGSHNGKSYVAYTFYIRNAGKEDLGYDGKVKVASASKGVEKAARVRVYRNGEPVTYAAPASGGGNEPGCENFESNDVVCHLANDDFKVGYVDKYTVVIWLDGDDPECVDDIVGGEVEFAMDFDSDGAEDTNLLTKFVRDIGDTLTGTDPIGASGTDAPDYYQNNTVTWDNRRNQDNPPA